MTVLAQLSERNFPAQDNTFAFSLDAGVTLITVTLEHPDWPEGECVRIRITWPTGDTGEMSSGGGVVRDRAGNPTGGTTQLTWQVYKPAGLTSGTAHVQVMQGLRSAVLVEAT